MEHTAFFIYIGTDLEVHLNFKIFANVMDINQVQRAENRDLSREDLISLPVTIFRKTIV